MHPKDAEGIANSVDLDQTAPPIWVCTVCPDLSVRKLRKITVIITVGQLCLRITVSKIFYLGKYVIFYQKTNKQKFTKNKKKQTKIYHPNFISNRYFII